MPVVFDRSLADDEAVVVSSSEESNMDVESATAWNSASDACKEENTINYAQAVKAKAGLHGLRP